MILVGPSGCGKSTTLNMIAGLEDITEGELRIGGEVVNDKAPKDRDIAMVFQSYALYPHMTVQENMGFALKLARQPQSVVDDKVNEAARILSGGGPGSGPSPSTSPESPPTCRGGSARGGGWGGRSYAPLWRS